MMPIPFFYIFARFFRYLVWLYRNEETRGLLLLVVIFLGAGTIFYAQVEAWFWLDALYFSVITLTTIGYGDFAPQTDAGKAFTIAYILAGLGLITAFITTIAELTLEEQAERRKAIRQRQDNQE